MIKCTWQIEIGPRGTKRKELRLYNIKGKLIIKIIPDFEGWSHDDLQEIYNSLKELGVEHY